MQDPLETIYLPDNDNADVENLTMDEVVAIMGAG